MKTVAIIFWSATGNTESMAHAIAAGVVSAGAAAAVVSVDKADDALVRSADAIALGCPSMGNEVLEEADMEPFVAQLELQDLTGKPLALFGSYDWGDGQWMRDWEARMAKTGARLVAPGVIVQLSPDAEGLACCDDLGRKLAGL